MLQTSIHSRRRRGWFSVPWMAWLVAAGIALLLFVGWRATRGRGITKDWSPTFQAEAPPATTNDVLVIPVKDKSGKVSDPMVLVPINGTAPVRASRTNDVATVRSNVTTPSTTLTNIPTVDLPGFEEKILSLQVALARRAISSGSLDGLLGPQTRAALRAYERREGLSASGVPDHATLALLQASLQTPLFTNYILTTGDVARLLPLGKTWLEKSQQARMDYETLLELVAERTHSNPKLVAALNAGLDWNRLAAGDRVKVVAIAYPEPAGRAAFVRISIGARTLQVFDAETNLLAHFPCSIAARVEKRPVGEALHVVVVAPNPNYTFDPEVFPESAEARQIGRKLILQPGPNNPVGAAWIGLDKPGYGMHGTPKPEDVGRTESHGCFRLANWNAEQLLKLVTVGTPVFVDP